MIKTCTLKLSFFLYDIGYAYLTIQGNRLQGVLAALDCRMNLRLSGETSHGISPRLPVILAFPAEITVKFYAKGRRQEDKITR